MVDIFKKVEGELVSLQSAEPGCWINIYPPFNQETLESISKEYDVPLDFLTDSLDIDERSRYEEEDGVQLIVLNTPVVNDEDLIPENQAYYVTIPIGIISLSDRIITISPYRNPVIDSFINKRIKNFDPADQSQFALQLFNRNVFYFLLYLKQLNNKRNLFEEELYNSSRNEELSQLMDLQKSLVYFVTTLRGNELLMMKLQRTDFLHIKNDEEKSDFLQDIIVDNSQALEMSNVYTNILNSTMDAFASIISNNLNNVMKRLTLITIVLMVPTLIASFYGMNVPLPGNRDPTALIWILLITVFISVFLMWYFMRRRWF